MYLGVTIDDKLNWNAHIKEVTNKANIARGFLQQNLRACPVQIKSDCYKSLICPIIGYACVVCPLYTRHNINQVEMVQWRAARLIANNFSRYASVTYMLHNLGWTSLEHRRKELCILTLYKIFYNLIDVRKHRRYINPNHHSHKRQFPKN